MGQQFNNLLHYGDKIQGYLFPFVEEKLGPLTEKQQGLVAILEVIQIEWLLPGLRGYVGRPKENRSALPRAFVAKAVYNMTTTKSLIERLQADPTLQRICGWERRDHIPSEVRILQLPHKYNNLHACDFQFCKYMNQEDFVATKRMELRLSRLVVWKILTS
jgi:hypothetical protein